MKDKRHRSRSQKKKQNSSSFTIKHKDTLLASLLSNLPHKGRKLLKAVLRDRQVSVDGTTVTQFDHALTPGQLVEVSWERVLQVKHPRELNIIYLDQDLIIINKPAGLLTVATEKEKRRTAYSMLDQYIKADNPDNRIFIIHRLDRETSGLLMFARSESVKRKVLETWNTTISQRTYVGVVAGEVTSPQGTHTSWLTESKAFVVYSSQNPQLGKKAVTHYKKIKGNKTFSLLKLHLETNCKHQIRVHMQDIQHPIIGDKKYGSKIDPIKRMGLHAQVLAFTHPTTGKSCHFDTGVPGKFLKLFQAEKNAKDPGQPKTK